MSTVNRPLPRPSVVSKPFWESARRGLVSVQRCTACGEHQHPPKPMCTQCWSTELAWVETSGRGTVYSYTICHWATVPYFKDRVPYIVAMVDLDEGARVTTGIVDCAIEDIQVGLPVVAVFDAVSDDMSLINFKPA